MQVVLFLFAHHFLPLAFQIPKYNGRKMSGEYLMLLPAAVSKNMFFSVPKKNVSLFTKAALRDATFADRL
jgi:hypothetical protein